MKPNQVGEVLTDRLRLTVISLSCAPPLGLASGALGHVSRTSPGLGGTGCDLDDGK